MFTATVLDLLHRFDDSTVVEIDPDKVTPGVLGFVFTGLFAVAVIFIGFDMYRRVRRMRYRVEVREEIEREMSGEQDSSSEDDEGQEER